ncbi:response regulator [Marinicrinis lubricantis]|uniref:Response regulator n=1 Tax=Marinicrinis lubricantis TaxID=2086470 RepID=A0ABW1ILT9_9BACL
MTSEKIVVVDDEPDILELITLYLHKEGYQVVTCGRGDEVIRAVEVHQPDLIILDVLLPGMDGIEVCRSIRKISNVPILFISCNYDDLDVILGLGVGGDDYIPKPFSPSQLVARVKAHLRRNNMKDSSNNHHVLKFDGLEIDLHSHSVTVRGVETTLSSKEFDLLALLASSPKKVFKIDQLYSQIWGSDSLGDTRTLMVHISNLRKKIEPDPAMPRFIITIRGVGYKFQP